MDRVICIGSTDLDIFFYTKEGIVVQHRGDLLRRRLIGFERSAKILAQDLKLRHGGSAANAALSFARLGIPAGLISAVGDDAIGAEELRYLRKNHVGTSHMQVIPGAATNFSLIVTALPGSDHVIFLHHGSSDKMQVSDRTFRSMNASWLYVTSLGHNWKSQFATLLRYLDRSNAKLTWNPGALQLKGPVKVLKSCIRKTTVLLVNYDEALELLVRLTGRTKYRTPARASSELSRFGADYTMVTHGREGAYLAHEGRVVHRAAWVGKTVNKTGAGDAFGSGFVAGLILYRHDVSRALSLAVSNSHFVVQSIGAQTGLLTRHTLNRVKWS